MCHVLDHTLGARHLPTVASPSQAHYEITNSNEGIQDVSNWKPKQPSSTSSRQEHKCNPQLIIRSAQKRRRIDAKVSIYVIARTSHRRTWRRALDRNWPCESYNCRWSRRRRRHCYHLNQVNRVASKFRQPNRLHHKHTTPKKNAHDHKSYLEILDRCWSRRRDVD